MLEAPGATLPAVGAAGLQYMGIGEPLASPGGYSTRVVHSIQEYPEGHRPNSGTNRLPHLQLPYAGGLFPDQQLQQCNPRADR